MCKYSKIFIILIIGIFFAACNPTYMPVNPTGVVRSDELEGGVYLSIGSVGRKIRPLGFRGLVANFGVYYRKGVTDGIDYTIAVDNTSINIATGIRQDIEAAGVLRPRIGVGWMSGIVGCDYAHRLSKGEDTNYSIGGSALAWVGDAFWTDDPGKAYGIRIGPFGHTGAEPRFTSTVSGGVRLDYVPLQFGGEGAPETIVDLFGGKRNPYAEPIDRSVLSSWPKPRFAFAPGAIVVTIGPALSFHRDGLNWESGGEKGKSD
ncbi:MAG: hypothetical protein P9L99_12535 [Candidatus Lernaella stagnicola]|nr:hypothetical protein [Candidatus Lernaella stagnicola]